MPLQTRVNKAESDKIREAMEADRERPTAWIRDILVAASELSVKARRALLAGGIPR